MASIKVQELDKSISDENIERFHSKTQLWIYEPGTPTAESGRLMNTITRSSDFKHVPRTRDLNKLKEREKTAHELAEGWIANGGKHSCHFLIVHI